MQSVVASAAAITCAIDAPARAATDIHFDYTSFDNPNTPGANPHFGQNQFNVVNYPSINGNYMMTSTDTHRPEMTANNNNLAEFYNWLEQRYEAHTTKDGNLSADEIDAYVVSNSTSNGPKPNWIVLNEISASLWPSDATYRTWVVNVATRLHDTYGYNVVTYSPFANPGNNSSDWKALAAKSYIGVENYLSGEEVMSNGTNYASRLSWAQAQYAWSKTAFGNLGVSSSRLFLGEDFSNTTSGTAWGRAGLSVADWDTVIQIRQDAIRNANYAGYLAYGWGGNPLGISEAEQIEFEYYYRSRLVMGSQQPQWLSDSAINVNGTVIPLSWSQPLNWLGGVPNANGAIANFYRTNTAARTITLDGSRTVGTLSFNSASSYTISPGSGGTLTLNNSGAGATVTVPQGSHTISAPVAFTDNATFNVSSTLSLTGGITNSPGKTLTKTGAGTLTIAGTQTHGSGAVLTVSAGTINLNTDAGSTSSSNLTVNANAATNFNATQHLKALNIANTATATLSAGGGKVLVTSGLSITNGTFQLNDNDMVVRNGSRASVEGLVKAGFGNANWHGTGITSSTAAALTSNFATAIGVATASDLSINSFDSQTVNGSDVLVKYTWNGDATMDGVVNADDYNKFLDGFVSGAPARWFNGDFTYDGIVNADDYNFFLDGLLAYNASNGITLSPAFRAELADFATAQGVPFYFQPLPEPTLLAPLAILSLLARRRRCA